MTTFDLHHYQFLGSCSYLLAKDFEGGDFEVFGEYESEAGATRLKSVVVHSPNIDVTLSVDGTITSRGMSEAEVNSLHRVEAAPHVLHTFRFLFLFYLKDCISSQYSKTSIICNSLSQNHMSE